MKFIANPRRGAAPLIADCPMPSVDAATVGALLTECPAHGETPLVSSPALAQATGVGAVLLKDERGRMGLGSFKALGAAYVIARDAVATGQTTATALAGRTYVTASAGNHGMSVAAGARAFGARAVVYLDANVPQPIEARLRSKGAEVIREGTHYEASMAAAAKAAEDHGWSLLSDSAWPGYIDRPHQLMEGYSQMAEEMARQIDVPPSHIFLQAGVGGMAAAVAAYARKVWGDGPVIVVVEPDRAPAVLESVQAGRVVMTQGGVSRMGRLDCKEPSIIGLNGLARDADFCATISEEEAVAGVDVLAGAGFETSESGGAGFAALAVAQGAFGMDDASRVLCILSEGTV